MKDSLTFSLELKFRDRKTKEYNGFGALTAINNVFLCNAFTSNNLSFTLMQ